MPLAEQANPKAAADAIKFTVEKQAAETLEPMLVAAQNQSDMSCSLDDPEGCEVCGSSGKYTWDSC